MNIILKMIDNDVIGIYKDDKSLWGILVHQDMFDSIDIKKELVNGTELQCELKVEDYDV
jgi:hypothetical protein